jgi:hypothetical protein
MAVNPPLHQPRIRLQALQLKKQMETLMVDLPITLQIGEMVMDLQMGSLTKQPVKKAFKVPVTNQT